MLSIDRIMSLSNKYEDYVIDIRRKILHRELNHIPKSTANSFAGSSETIIRKGYPSVFNNVKLTEIIEDAFRTNYVDLVKDIKKDASNKDTHKYVLTTNRF